MDQSSLRYGAKIMRVKFLNPPPGFSKEAEIRVPMVGEEYYDDKLNAVFVCNERTDRLQLVLKRDQSRYATISGPVCLG